MQAPRGEPEPAAKPDPAPERKPSPPAVSAAPSATLERSGSDGNLGFKRQRRASGTGSLDSKLALTAALETQSQHAAESFVTQTFEAAVVDEAAAELFAVRFLERIGALSAAAG